MTDPAVRDTPAPRVLLSALGPKMLRIAGELADGTVATWVRPDLVADYLVPHLTSAAPTGTTPRVVVATFVSVTADPEQLRADIAERFAGAAGIPAYRAILDRGGLTSLAETAVVGELRRFRDAGTTDLVVFAWGSPSEQDRTLNLLAARVTELA